ncbi:helix-turn-helix transcriptional regulator [Streptococcus salivarius]|uniref:helix-turn-helix transcriptional regulator n=1 Tax=Streptococcus salivarius TaxID=1304 RepID=UPI00093C952F|nr:helix-turn-helix transcriptional regulator [Streptococcus salivarius]
MSITKLRLERGLSKAQLARELGVSVRTILRWEQDMMCMSLRHAVRLAEFFEISLDELFEKTLV